MKALVISCSLVFLVLAVSGCVQNQQGPVCNPPYIAKGYDCCLDTNANNICDSDEQAPPQPYCGDSVCDANESCSTCATDCGACAPVNDTAKYIKSLAYNTTLKYVPKTIAGDFMYVPRPNDTVAFDTWEYPQLFTGINTSKYVIAIGIRDYHFDLGGPSSIYDRIPTQGTTSGEMYIENTENGRILVTDRTLQYTQTPPSGKYEYSVEFTCQAKYDIKITTWDFYGADVLPLFKDYDIDKMAINNAAAEILNYC